MKNTIIIMCVVFISTISYGQMKYDWGEKFDFNNEQESNPQLVLLDNYNTYLVSVTEIDGMMSSHTVTLRKFDQKNQLVDTYTQKFEKLDAGTLYNYLGYKEISASKLAVFAESYSGKEKKKNIYQYLFDKTAGTFTTSLVISYPIESAMKSGSTDLVVSENGRYIGILNKRDGGRKEAVLDNVLIIDAANLAVLWNKDVALEDKFFNKAFTVTNSGKAVLLRAAKGFKMSNYLTIVTQAAQEDKQFEEAVMLHDPKAISIGQADYIIDFNYAAKGLRKGDYENLMLYDIGLGKTVKNSPVKVWNALKDINSIQIRNVFIQNNEIHLFTEAKIKAGSRQEKVNAYSSMTMEQPFYKFGPSHLVSMSWEGEVKDITTMSTNNNSMANFFHSFGLQQINGRYYINTGSAGYTEIYEQKFATGNAAPSVITSVQNGSDPYKNESAQYVSQLFGYVKDAKKVVLVRVHPNHQISLVSLLGFPQDK